MNLGLIASILDILSIYPIHFRVVTRDEMTMFMTGVLENMEEECRAAMLHDNMDLGRWMVHA